MNGMPSDSFSQRVAKPAVLVVLLVLLALGLATKESLAVRDEADIYNAQFPAAPNCNACEYYVQKLKLGGKVCASPTISPLPCALPSFPAAQDFAGMTYAANTTLSSASAAHNLSTPNYPYLYYNGDLLVNMANVTFQGPAGTGFLTIYVAGYLCVQGTAGNHGIITIQNNVRFVASGTVSTGTFCGANPTISFSNNSDTIINAGSTAVFMGTNITTGNARITINYPAGPGDPLALLIIATGTFTETTGSPNSVDVSGGIFTDGTITTGNSPGINNGAFYAATCPITNGSATFTSAAAATSAIQKIDVCAAPGSP